MTGPHTMIGRVITKTGREYEMMFDLDTPLSGFDMSHMPVEIECVEILEVLWDTNDD